MPRGQKTDTAVAIEAAVKVVEEQPGAQDFIIMNNGIRLRCKAVPILTVRHALTAIKKPEPPVIHNEEKGRTEVWEGDPTYQAELAQWEEQIGDTTLNVMIMLGTQVDEIPEGIQAPEDEDWIETLEAAGININTKTKAARYLSWIRFYAISSNSDYARISEAVARKSGLLERDVQTSLESFRGGENGRTNLEATPTEQHINGDNLQSSDSGDDLGD